MDKYKLIEHEKIKERFLKKVDRSEKHTNVISGLLLKIRQVMECFLFWGELYPPVDMLL